MTFDWRLTKIESVQTTGQAIMDASYWLKLEHLLEYQLQITWSDILCKGVLRIDEVRYGTALLTLKQSLNAVA